MLLSSLENAFFTLHLVVSIPAAPGINFAYFLHIKKVRVSIPFIMSNVHA